MRQLYRVHATLLVCAYVAFLGYFALTDPKNPVAVLFAGRSDAGPPAASSSSRSKPIDKPAEVTSVVANTATTEDPAPVVEEDDSARQQEERVRLSEVRLQATGAGEPVERAEAIDQLNSATPETLQALQTVVTSDSTARNRIRALNSLRVLATQEDAKDAVLTIVHLATTDTNASVASRATEVYREITREQADE